MAAGAVRVEGLDETVRVLRKVDRELPKRLAKVHRTSAISVREEARGNIGDQPIPKQKTLVTHFATPRTAGVTLRASRFPWAMGAEFGAKQFAQFKPWTGNQFTLQFPGYIVQPSIGKLLPVIHARYADNVLKAFKGKP